MDLVTAPNNRTPYSPQALEYGTGWTTIKVWRTPKERCSRPGEISRGWTSPLRPPFTMNSPGTCTLPPLPMVKVSVDARRRQQPHRSPSPTRQPTIGMRMRTNEMLATAFTLPLRQLVGGRLHP